MGEAVLAHVGPHCLMPDCRSCNDHSKVANERGIDIHVESAGTAGYHIGEEPDER